MLRLIDGQLVLLVKDQDARCAGGEGSTMLGAVVEKRCTVSVLISRISEIALSYDACSQVVLPWAAPTDGWANALRSDAKVLRDFGRPPSGATILQLEEFTETVEHDLSRITDPRLREPVARGLETARKAFSQVQPKLDEDEDTWFKRSRNVFRTELARALDPESLELILSKLVRETGGVGVRRYAVGQPLAIRQSDGAWVDVTVRSSRPEGAHKLRLDWSAAELWVSLHPWNHAPRILDNFTQAHLRYTEELQEQHSSITDALTGRALSVFEQMVPVEAVLTHGHTTAEQPTDVGDARHLHAWLEVLHNSRCKGEPTNAPACALLTAGPGTQLDLHP